MALAFSRCCGTLRQPPPLGACAVTMALVLGTSLTGCGRSEPSTQKAQQAQESAAPTEFTENLPAATYPYPANGALLGQGWDTFNDSPTTSSCVDVEAAPLERSSYTSNVEHVISTYSLLKEVAVSASASYSGTGTKASANVVAKRTNQVRTDAQNFLFTFESSSGSTFAVAPGTVQQNGINPTDSTVKLMDAAKGEMAQERLATALSTQLPSFKGASIKLSTEASTLLGSNPAEFRRRCGEGFVAAIHRGARVQLLLSQTNASQAEKEAFAASLSASGFGGSAKASYSTSSDKKLGTSSLHYTTFQEGGVPLKPTDLAIGSTGKPDQLINLEDVLPKPEQLQVNPTAFRVVVVPYANVDPRVASALPTPLRMLSISDYYVALNDLHMLAGDVIQQARTEMVQDTPGANRSFDAEVIKAYGGIEGLESVRDAIHRDLILLETLLQQCYGIDAPDEKDQAAAQNSAKPETATAGEKCTVTGATKLLKAAIDKTLTTPAAPAASASADNRSGTEAWKDAVLALAAKAPMQAQAALKGVTVVASSQNNTGAAAAVSPESSQATSKIEQGLVLRNGAIAVATDRSSLPEFLKSIQAMGRAQSDTAFDAFVADLKRYQDDLEDKGPSEDFFYRFFWYLTQIPLPRKSVALNFKVTTSSAVATQAAASTEQTKMVNAVISQRLAPWKSFFCTNLKREALCVPDANLRTLAMGSVATLSVSDFVYEPPPAPPAKSKKRCKFGRGVWC